MVLTVLITMVGAQTSPSIIKAIKDNGERIVKVIGVDPVEIVPGAFIVDSFHTITASFVNEDKYIKELIEICQSEDVNMILPCGNEDCLAITKNIQQFENLGIIVISSNYEILNNALDKYYAYNIIKEACPENAPEFYLIKTFDDFQKYSQVLDFPQERLVIKPRHGRGGRGVFVIDPEINFKTLMKNKPQGNYPIEVIENMIKDNDFEEFILMEYLPGEIYSAYALCRKGESILIIPNKRIWGNASNTLIGKVDMNNEVINAVKILNSKFSFDYNVNYEFAIAHDGKPKVFDVNSRIAASTAIFRNMGINMPFLSIKLALNEEFKIPPIKKDIVFMRYLKAINLRLEDRSVFEL